MLLIVTLHLVLNNSGLDFLGRSRDANTLIRKTHLLCKGTMWDPAGAVTSIGFFHHLIYLFQSQALSLRDEEVGEGEGEAAEGAPEKEDFGTEVGVAFARADKVGGDDGNDLRKLLASISMVERIDLRSSRTNWMTWICRHHGSG